MTAGKKWLPKPKRPVDPHPGVWSIPRQSCPKCGRLLDEGKYHDCGDQAALPVE